jgi:MFS family permease
VAATTIAVLSLFGDLYPPAQRGRATMVMAIGQAGGASAAFALGGALLTIVGLGPHSWRWAMFWMNAPLVAVLFTMLATREPPRTGVAIKDPTPRESYVEFWRYRGVIVPLLIGEAMIGTALGAPMIWAAPTLSRSLSLSPERVGAIMALVMLVSGVVGPIWGGVLADFCQRTGGPRRSVFALGGLTLLCTPMSLFAVAPGAVVSGFLLVLFIASISAASVMGTTLITVVIPNELRGLCIGVVTATTVLFSVGLAPLMVSLLSGAIGGAGLIGRALAMVCALTCFLATLTFGFGIRYYPRALNASSSVPK